MEALIWFWLAAALIFIIIEIFAPGFIFACFVVGSLAGAATAFFAPESYLTQGAVFAVVSIILIPATRPLAAKITKEAPIQSNMDGLIENIGVVKKAVSEVKGLIKVEGQVWQARSEQDIEPGKKVKILSVDGTKLNVKEITE